MQANHFYLCWIHGHRTHHRCKIFGTNTLADNDAWIPDLQSRLHCLAAIFIFQDPRSAHQLEAPEESCRGPGGEDRRGGRQGAAAGHRGAGAGVRVRAVLRGQEHAHQHRLRVHHIPHHPHPVQTDCPVLQLT